MYDTEVKWWTVPDLLNAFHPMMESRAHEVKKGELENHLIVGG